MSTSTKTTLKRIVAIHLPTFQESSSNDPDSVLEQLNNAASSWSETAAKATLLVENNPYNLEQVLVPFTSVTRFVKSIEDSRGSVKIAIIEGLSDGDYVKAKTALWERFEILVIDPLAIDFVRRDPDGAYDYHRTQIDQTSKLNKMRRPPEQRYEQLRELMAEKLNVIQIAEQMRLSVPAIYQLRTRFKDELLRDVGSDAPGMRFTKSHEDAS
jgi:hypothetical protein